jgi:DNA-directed RNA polymerase specialized sigma24 family protein
MATELKTLVDRWYAEGRPLHLLDEIVELARPIAKNAARSSGLGEADSDDVAQHAIDKLAEQSKRPDVRIDRPDALVWRIAENKARDLHRRRKRRSEGDERLKRDPTVTGGHVASPEELHLDRENANQVQAIVRDALRVAPDNYKRVLELHFIEGVAIEAIAARYYEEMRGEVDTKDPVAVRQAQKRARDRVDQHLTRGKRWLAQRVAHARSKADT